jgi:tetratricopeptide (TPR) repeat protein
MDERLSFDVFALSWQNQTPAEVLVQIGEWLQEQGEFEAAARFYAAATVLEQDCALAYFRWGKLLLKQRNFSEAVKVLARAASITPDHAPTWYHLSQAYFDLGDYQQAAQAAENALKNDPNHAGAFLIRLRCAQLCGDEVLIRELLARIPNSLLSSKEVRRIAEGLGILLVRE